MGNQITPSQIIDALGGTLATSRICEVGESAVSQWRKKGISKDKMRIINLLYPELLRRLAMGLETEVTSKRKKRSHAIEVPT